MMVYSTTPFFSGAQLFPLGYVTVQETSTGHSHTLVGFLIPRANGHGTTPIYMDISKKGKDGQWYPVDGFKSSFVGDEFVTTPINALR